MATKNHSFEASLLYNRPPKIDLETLASELSSILDTYEMAPNAVEHVDGMFTLFICDALTLLIAQTDRPLPVGHFLEARRPPATVHSEAEVLSVLTRHEASLTILVVDAEDAPAIPGNAYDRTKRAICWDVAEHLDEVTGPELLFWCESDMLYTSEEFERACGYIDLDTPLHDRAQPVVAAIAAPCPDPLHEPVKSEPVFDKLDEKEHLLAEYAAARTAAEDDADDNTTVLDAVLSMTLPSDLASRLETVKERMDPRSVLHRTALSCSSATIGLCTVPAVITLLN